MAATRIDDRWLWFGAGIFFFCAVKGIRYALTDMVRLTELDRYPKNKPDREGDPEDGIPLSTLRTLYHSPNPSISAAAQSLIIKRFAALPGSTEILKQDIDSDNPRKVRLARQTVQYLCEWDWQMRGSLPLDFANDDASPDQEDTIAEQDELQMDIDRMIAPMQNRALGVEIGMMRRMMEEEGEEPVVSMEELSAEIERGSQGTARFAGWDRIPAPEVLAGAAQAEMRRRRREAMVFHEGGGDVEEADIFRPRR